MPTRRQLLAAGAAAFVPVVRAPSRPHAGWREVPIGVGSGLLYSVAGRGSELWAVGTSFAGPDATFAPLALRKGRAGWAPTTSPLPQSRLFDVAVEGARDVWAVGEKTKPIVNSPLPHVQHWNGEAWKEIGLDVPGADQGGLTSVATARRDVWVAGWAYADATQASWTLVYHYGNDRWEQLTDPALDRLGYVDAVLPVSSTEVWVAGFGIAGRSGGRWRSEVLPVKADRVVSIQGLTRHGREVWAVGHLDDPVLWRRPIVLRHDGRRWTELRTPAVPAQLWSLSFLNGKPVAVGEDHTNRGPYVLTWQGSRFVEAEKPPRASQLYGSATRNGELWVAGCAAEVEAPYLATRG